VYTAVSKMMVNVKALPDIVRNVLLAWHNDNYITEMRKLDEVAVLLIRVTHQLYPCFKILPTITCNFVHS